MTTYAIEIDAENPHHAIELREFLASDATRAFLAEHGLLAPRDVRLVRESYPEPNDLSAAVAAGEER